MLFFQPVVVHDASAADRSPPAEVRVAEKRAPEQEVWSDWTRTMLAQSSLDNRSPFGANAADRNDVTPPAPTPHNPSDTVMPPSSGAAPGTATPADSASNTRIPPPEQTQAPGATGQPDAGPPPPVTVGSKPETTTGAGNAGGTTSTPEPVEQPSSSTFPGAREVTLPGGSSGASNSR